MKLFDKYILRMSGFLIIISLFCFYSSDKMNRRLSSHSEMCSNSYDVSDEYDKKAYLRRKIARGKRM